MESKLSMNARLLGATLIKVVAFILVIPSVLSVGRLGSLALTCLFQPFDHQYLWGQVLPELWLLVVNVGFYGLLFFGAGKISRVLFRDDDVVALEGDPYSWAIPALQIAGLVYLMGGIIGLFPVIQSFREHLEANDAIVTDKTYWKEIWSVFVQLLIGFLLFRNPRWLASKMKRFGKLEW
jgi:hypothetical protein